MDWGALLYELAGLLAGLAQGVVSELLIAKRSQVWRPERFSTAAVSLSCH